jgi:hypothetical protein
LKQKGLTDVKGPEIIEPVAHSAIGSFYFGKPNFSDGKVTGILGLRGGGWQATEKIRLPGGRLIFLGNQTFRIGW